MGKKKQAAAKRESGDKSTSDSNKTRNATYIAALVAVLAAALAIFSRRAQKETDGNHDDSSFGHDAHLQQPQRQGCHPKRQHLCSKDQLDIADAAHKQFARGRELAAKGFQLEAIEAFEASLRIDNTTAFASAASQNLGLLLARRGDRGSAMAALQHAVRLDPESMYAHYSFANAIIDRSDDWGVAEKHYELALKYSSSEESPPGQSLPMIVLTSHGELLRRIAHRRGAIDSNGRNVLSEARNKLERAFDIAKSGGAASQAAIHTIISLQDVFRRLGDAAARDDVLEWAVQHGLWRDKRQYPIKFNHALYGAMAKPINPWLTNTERMLVLQRAKVSWREIRDEFDAAKRQGLKPVGQRVGADMELYDRKTGQDWSEFPILAEGNEFAGEVAGLTTEIFRRSVSPRGQVAFSVVSPGARIALHCGPSNEMITCHLGLRVPDAPIEVLGISVAGIKKTWEEGEWICFEDSFEHKVWNNAQEPRAVLLVNLKHPYMK